MCEDSGKNGMFVITHKPIDDKVDISGYHYLAVGKKLLGIPYSDSEYDNISKKNKNYCELTGLYWIWKNSNFSEIGLCHYRRFFCKVQSGFFIPLSVDELSIALKDCDIILPQKVNVHMDYLTYYEKCLRNDALRQCCEFLVRRDGNYKSVINSVLSSKSYYCYNMFYASRKTVNDYCQWLFEILFDFEPLIDMKGWNLQQQRVFGYLSEFLMNVWVNKNELRVKEVKVSQAEEFPSPLSTDASQLKLSLWKEIGYEVLPCVWPVLSKILVSNSLKK